MQDYEGRKHKEKDIEILYSVHCALFPGRGLVDFLKQGLIPNLYHDIHGETPDYETSNKNCISHGRPRSGLSILSLFAEDLQHESFSWSVSDKGCNY